MTVEKKQLVKILTWYDNEMSYTAQMIRTMKYLAQNLVDSFRTKKKDLRMQVFFVSPSYRILQTDRPTLDL